MWQPHVARGRRTGLCISMCFLNNYLHYTRHIIDQYSTALVLQSEILYLRSPLLKCSSTILFSMKLPFYSIFKITTSPNNGISYMMFDLFSPPYLIQSNKLHNIEHIHKTIVHSVSSTLIWHHAFTRLTYRKFYFAIIEFLPSHSRTVWMSHIL